MTSFSMFCNCAISEALSFEGQYNVWKVLTFLSGRCVRPGCPPDREALLEGFLKLEEKITGPEIPRVESVW